VTKETHTWEKAKVIKKYDSYWKNREKTFKNYSSYLPEERNK
jgi:hypothetical protein